MYELLAGMRVVEASSFVASPSAGLYLAQMGAEIIRVDQIGGGPDFRRWPKSNGGDSFYWEGLNRAKKSVAVDLREPEGREIVQRLATAPGDNGGLLVTNYPVDGFLSHDKLAAMRSDLITVRVMGMASGSNALDYTVNCAVGIPQITGPAAMGEAPVNHVLPAWDLLAGAYAAFSLMCAECKRKVTGEGGEVRVPLSDLAIASIANMGQIAEVLYQDGNRARLGNEVYGAFGRDFITADGKRLMIMAVTPRQWRGLVKALSIEMQVAGIEAQRSVSFDRDEGVRFEHRDALMPLVADRVALHDYSDLVQIFETNAVCWGLYRSMREAADDPEYIRDNPIFEMVNNPSGFSYPAPGAAATLPAQKRQPVKAAPLLGAHTDEVLSDVLGLDDQEIARLIDNRVVAQANG